jgi:hypothetical protein
MADDIVLDVSMAATNSVITGRVWWLVRPLAWKVEASTAPGSAGRASPSCRRRGCCSAVELTVTVDLSWVDGDWRVGAVRDAPGPTPMTGPNDRPWDAVPFDETLSGFTRMDGEPVR